MNLSFLHRYGAGGQDHPVHGFGGKGHEKIHGDLSIKDLPGAKGQKQPFAADGFDSNGDMGLIPELR